jgi:hypothetical protein
MDLGIPILSNPILLWNIDIGKLLSLNLNSKTYKRFRDNRLTKNIIYGKAL